MTIKEITYYQTDDGKVHTTLKQAEFWEIFTIKSYEKPSEPEYNMRNEGYTNTYYPVGRD